MEWELGSAADPVERGLQNYVRNVVETLGLTGDSSYVQSEPLSLYLAVDGHLPGHPNRDVALLWDEERGWAGALETGCGEDLIVVSYVGGDPLPKPEVVASYTAALLRGDAPGRSEPPAFPVAEVRRGLRWMARTPDLAGSAAGRPASVAPAWAS
ncbi:DUF6292 family protein [Saccharomonospora sp. NB11]|jgi:hypothetical protein|uniref:DUF6292 family protein n=1 Tax=Saccharomonospora sp. NB11 TaxID=1642298 RepID=UPI0018CFF7CF|nr:DUF6292 family protein [Saccharomonospora sp. NB11]